MPASRFLLPLAIGLTALGSLSGGLVAAADLRDDQRRERLAALERREQERERQAVVRYREQLTPLALAVYDHVQPLQQAHADLDAGNVPAVDVLIDVGNHVASPTGLPVLRRKLGDVTPARSLLDQHRVLLQAVDDIAYAGELLKELQDSDDELSYAEVIARADLGLDDATRDWTRALNAAYEGAQTPAVPVETGADGPRVPVSHASYLREAGNECLAGIEAFAATGAGKREPSLEEVRAGLKELTTRVPLLAKVKAPTADDKVVATTIRVPLRRTVELAGGFDAAVAAARRGDAAGVRAGQAQLARGEVAAEKAAAGYRAYGSEVCALYLVGLEEGAAAKGDATRTT